MQHSFDIDTAKEYGLLEAILLNNLWFWIEKNKANEENFYDGEYWTYNSARAFTQLFPYVSQRQIQCALKKLIDNEILQTGNYNKNPYDRTLWYSFTLKGKSIMQKCKIDYAKMLNGLCENVKPIPDNKPYIKEIDNNKLLSTKKKTKNKVFIPPTLEEVKAFCEQRNKGVDYKKVFDYYSSNDWKDNKGNQVKNWKQKIIGVWEKDQNIQKVVKNEDTSYVDENGLIHI